MRREGETSALRMENSMIRPMQNAPTILTARVPDGKVPPMILYTQPERTYRLRQPRAPNKGMRNIVCIASYPLLNLKTAVIYHKDTKNTKDSRSYSMECI